jgi:hypothetical protein
MRVEMKKNDEMRAEYDLSQLAGGARGKYYRRARRGTKVVLIEPDLAEMFPDSAAVNRELRVLADAIVAIDNSRRRRHS